MGGFIKIENEEITEVLETTTRQYFVGNLSRPQQIQFVRDERLEIGISSYPEAFSEQPHKHDIATEYQYVISGWTEYMDTETSEVHTFRKGDFFAILPHTAYAQKGKAGTKILFIKTPSINDKKEVGISDEQQQWLDTNLRTIRTDYYHSANAPRPNSIKPAAAVAIINEKSEILMLRRKDNGKWTMPGGTMEFGESLASCATREVKEETGLSVHITDIIGTYTDPGVLVAYSDGEVRQEFTVVYYAEATTENVHLDGESSAYQWIKLDALNNIPLAESQKRRIHDVIRYYRCGEKRLT